MGMSIGFYRITGRHKRGWLITESAEDAPERFGERFPRRMGYTNLVFDVPHEYVKTCSCGEKCFYGCSGDAIYRPTDFTLFREKLKAEGYFEPDVGGECIFKEMTDWLEAHPDVYIEFS